LLVRLKDEAYLDQNGETRETLVNKTMPNFEIYDKRKKDVTRRPVNTVDIAGLRGDAQRGLTGHAAKRFEPGRLLMNW
jgi:hypothetical protein